MSAEESAELLGEVWRFPCGFDTRNRLLGFVVESNGESPPGMILDQLIKGGHYQAFSAGRGTSNNLLTLWAKKEPAVTWEPEDRSPRAEAMAMAISSDERIERTRNAIEKLMGDFYMPEIGRMIAKQDPARALESLRKPKPVEFSASCLRCHGEGAKKSGGCIYRVPIGDGWGIATTLFSEADVKEYMDRVIGDGSGVGSTRKIDILFTDPQATLRRVAEERDEADQRAMIPKMLVNWAKRDAGAAVAWLSQQEPSRVRYASIATFITEAPNLAFESAAAWAQEISDPAERSKSLNSVLTRWRNEDPAAADAWLRQQGLSK